MSVMVGPTGVVLDVDCPDVDSGALVDAVAPPFEPHDAKSKTAGMINNFFIISSGVNYPSFVCKVLRNLRLYRYKRRMLD